MLERPPGHLDEQAACGLILGHNQGQGLGYGGDIVPGGAADVELGGDDEVEAVVERRKGDKGALGPVPGVFSAENADDAVQRAFDRHVHADHVAVAENTLRQLCSEYADPGAVLHLGCAEKGPGDGSYRGDIPVIFVHAEQGILRNLFFLPGGVARGEGEKAGAGHPGDFPHGLGRMLQKLHRSGNLFLGRDGVLEGAFEDRGAAQQLKIFVQLLFDRVAHGQDRQNPGRAEGDGEHDAQVPAVLPQHLHGADP